MRILKNTAKSAESEPNGMKYSQEGWGPKVVMGKGGDALVSRIGSHYVVTIMAKPISMEQRISSLSIHFKELMNVLWSITSHDAGGNPFAHKPRRD